MRVNSMKFSLSSDFAEPLFLPSAMDPAMDPAPSTSDTTMGATPLDNSPPEESISILTSMGFPRTHSIRALKATVSLPSVIMSAVILLRGICPVPLVDSEAVL